MKRLGIICALYPEAACLTKRKPLPQEPVALDGGMLLVVSGAGRRAAQRAASRLAEEKVDCLLSFGCAGGLAPDLKAGDLAQPGEVLSGGASHKATACLPAAALGRLARRRIAIHHGAMATVDQAVATPSDKQALLRRTGAVCVDMESAAILETAAKRGIPAFVLRAILDTADMTLPHAILRRADEFGELNGPALLADLARAPRQIGPLLRLMGAWGRARKTLRGAFGELRQACRDEQWLVSPAASGGAPA